MASYIEMPKLSDTMTEGTVVQWRKAVGDEIQMGDVVAEVETDKAVMELEAFGEGTLSAIYVPEGGKARIGQRLAQLSAPGQRTTQTEPGDTASGQAPVASATTTAPPAVPISAPPPA